MKVAVVATLTSVFVLFLLIGSSVPYATAATDFNNHNYAQQGHSGIKDQRDRAGLCAKHKLDPELGQ